MSLLWHMDKEQIISDDVMYKKMHETSLTNSFVHYNNIGICRHTIDVFWFKISLIKLQQASSIRSKDKTLFMPYEV
jgi:hypothetical protein